MISLLLAATLPKTARLKLIDVWFLFGFLTCFVVFLLHVLLEVINPDSASRWAKNSRQQQHQAQAPRKRPVPVVQDGVKFIAKQVKKIFNLFLLTWENVISLFFSERGLGIG